MYIYIYMYIIFNMGKSIRFHPKLHKTTLASAPKDCGFSPSKAQDTGRQFYCLNLGRIAQDGYSDARIPAFS